MAFKASPSSQHQHCTDEAQKAETVLSAVIYIYIYINIYIYIFLFFFVELDYMVEDIYCYSEFHAICVDQVKFLSEKFGVSLIAEIGL